MSDNLSNSVLFPTETKDYKVKMGPMGTGLFANRNIKKGSLVLDDSIEFMFSDVVDGDKLLLQAPKNEKAASKKKTGDNNKDSEYRFTFELTNDVLTRTHGVPVLRPDPTGESAGTISWELEVPMMLTNHSYDPNIQQSSHDCANGEDYALRDIKKGEELTYNYVLQYYDKGPFFEKCLCGTKKCLGKMMGFKALSEEDKAKYFPFASPAVQAMYKADMGLGPPVKYEQTVFPSRSLNPSLPSSSATMRVVSPGPSHALAKVAVRKSDDTGEYGLYAMQDVAFGDVAYSFWCQDWPTFDGRVIPEIDMVFAVGMVEGDPKEGTVIRVNALECASRNRNGVLQFSCWDLLTAHSSEPNIMYDNMVSVEEEECWREAYAAKEIKKGDRLTVDFDSILWDRSESMKDNGDFKCGGAEKCTGKGFKFLSPEAKEELKLMSRRRVSPPYEGEETEITSFGKALSPFCASLLAEGTSLAGGETLESGSETSSSSSSSSSSSDEENSE